MCRNRGRAEDPPVLCPACSALARRQARRGLYVCPQPGCELVFESYDPATACPSCGSTDLHVERCTSGPHYSQVTCRACGRVTWGKAPWTLERARAFVMPYGKHLGRPIGELAESDPDYLRWLARTSAENPGIAAGIVLGQADPENPSESQPTEVVPSQQTCEDVTSTEMEKARSWQAPSPLGNPSARERRSP
jgi:uncharacterized protein (DUF3820 family)